MKRGKKSRNNNEISFSVWILMTATFVGLFFASFFNPIKTLAVTTTTWDFTTGGNYTYNSALIEVVGGVAKLIILDQTDSDNTSTGFGGGTNSNTQWDATNLWVELDATGLVENSSRLAADWTPQWDNLVSYWEMDNDWTDSKGSYDGTATLAVFETSGRVGSDAGDFTGLSDFTTIGDYDDFSFGDGSTDSPFSISVWVKNTGTGGGGTYTGIIGKDAGGVAREWVLAVEEASNELRFFIKHQGGGNQKSIDSTNVLPVNEWMHVLVTYDGSSTYQGIKIYMNGTLEVAKDPVDAAYTAMSNTAASLRIGRYFNSNTQNFKGDLDDVAIWNTDLTAGEVQTIYDRQLASYGGYFTSRIMDASTSTAQWTTSTWTPQAPYGKELPDNAGVETSYNSGNIDMTGNVLLFHMNETGSSAEEGGTITDNSGSGSNGTLNTGSDGLNKSTTGTFSDALTFDGSDDFVSTTNEGNYDFADTSFTVTGWFKTDSTSRQVIISKGGASNHQWSLEVSSAAVFGEGKVGVAVYNAAGTSSRTSGSSNAYNDGLWHHYVAKIDTGSTGEHIIYIDGVQDSSEISDTIGSNYNTGGSEPVRIGSRGDGFYFNGSIDEVSILSSTLSAVEALDHYKRGVLDLKYHVMSCDDASCSGETWIGPDGTAGTYYSELLDNGINTPSTTLTNILANQYFRYRVYLETASSTLSPELKSVAIAPDHYDGSDATIVNSATTPSYSILHSFEETLGGNNEGSVKYQLSPDNIGWNYWSGSAWASSTLGYTHTNTASDINTNISSFSSSLGVGSLFIKAFFRSTNAVQQVELDQLSVGIDPEIYFTSSTFSGLEGTVTTSLILEISDALASSATVDYTVSSTSSATGSGTDYTLADGTATITVGNTTTSIDIVTVDDSLDELNETIILTISSPSNVVLGSTTTITYTITDDDGAPTVAFTNSSSSALESTVTSSLELSLSNVSGQDVTVGYAVSATSSATGSGTDYTLADGTATITAGNTTTSVDIVVVDDSTDDNDETVIIVLSSPTNSTLGTNDTHTFTITDNDAAPVVEEEVSSGGGGGSPSILLEAPTVILDPFTGEEVEFQIEINGGDSKTNSNFVNLTLSGGNAQRMAISNNAGFESSNIEDYKTSVNNWDICSNMIGCPTEGEVYTVYVKFYSEYGAATDVFFDNILFTQKVTIIEKVVDEIVEKVLEPIIPDFLESDFVQNELLPEGEGIIEVIIEKIIKPIIPDFLKPEEEVVEPEVVTVPEIAPIVFRGEWNILPEEAVKSFVLAPIPKHIANLAKKFPELEETFKKVGIKKITDIEKLSNTNFKLPGITEITGLARTEIESGKFVLPKGIPIANLSPASKQKIPSEIVFARTSNELIDFNINLIINERGVVQQSIRTISGKPLQLSVKPDSPAKSVKGYLVLKPKTNNRVSYNINLHDLEHSELFEDPSFAEPIRRETLALENISLKRVAGIKIAQGESVDIEERMLLLEFEYTDHDGDGIYTAEIDSPVVEGEYEIITVIEFEDENLGRKEIRLITVVDPEGYIYEEYKGKEIRIPEAVVSIFWQNPQSEAYEAWLAREYQQENPQITDLTGKYSFLVPEGSYYLKIEAPGYVDYVGEPFDVVEGRGIHQNIQLTPKYSWLRFFDWKSVSLILIIILLFYSFYRDKFRKKFSNFKKI